MTNEAAMRLRDEKTLPPATLVSLTDQKVESKTKPIRRDVAAVRTKTNGRRVKWKSSRKNEGTLNRREVYPA
jgi:hypothetical protein